MFGCDGEARGVLRAFFGLVGHGVLLCVAAVQAGDGNMVGVVFGVGAPRRFAVAAVSAEIGEGGMRHCFAAMATGRGKRHN